MNYKWKKITKESKNIILFIGFIVLFFCYIFNFQIKGLPFSIVKLYVFITIIYFLVNKNKVGILSENKSDLLILFTATILPVFWGLLSSTVNNEMDFTFLKDIVNIPYYFLAFFVLKVYSKRTNQKLSFNYLALLFIISGFIQCVISFIGFVIPDIGKLLINIQTFNNDLERIRAEKFLLNSRLIGLGTRYWSAGVIFSVDLLLIAQLLSDKDILTEKYYKYLSVLYITIFTIGMMMSRTTIVGFIFSFLFVFKNSIKSILSAIKSFLPSLLVLSILSVFLVNTYQDRVIKIFNFGFEMFINLLSDNGFQSKSTNMMMKMYKFPNFDNYKTWILGDALFNNPNGIGYYKQTDIGYCRVIFYFGIFGLFILIITQAAMLLVLCYRLEKKYRFFLIVIGLMFLVLNLKGFQLIHYYIIPFFFIDKTNTIYLFDKRSLQYA